MTPKAIIPDPLKPGHIQGQNPATPERMPGHTGYYDDRETAPDDKKEVPSQADKQRSAFG